MLENELLGHHVVKKLSQQCGEITWMNTAREAFSGLPGHPSHQLTAGECIAPASIIWSKRTSWRSSINPQDPEKYLIVIILSHYI